MNIIIDARMIDKNLHGIARYAFELIKGISLENDIKLKLLTNDEELTKEIFKDYDNIKYIKMKSKFLSPFEIIELPIILNKYKKNHIFHSPSFSSSPFIKCKSFITIHDLNHLALPQYYSKFHKYYYKFVVKPFALKCEKIFTVSNFSKNEILKWLKCDEDKIIVTYNGIDEKFRVIDDKKSLNKIKEKYNLPDKFVLYIGNLKPHKNVDTLVKAMKNVKDDIKLIINGKVNEELENIIDELRLQNRIQFIGYVEEKDLPIIYNLACVFVFPSIYEGFGLPPLEAIASGCKAIVSDSTSLVEVTGDYATVFEPKNQSMLTNKINECLDDKYIFNENDIKNFMAKYSWEKLVLKTISSMFKEVFNENKKSNS